MAAAARPGPSDARVPCPLCGGLVHPIAGKCKHCKAELTSHRRARPAASTPLPALHGTATPSATGHAAPSWAGEPPPGATRDPREAPRVRPQRRDPRARSSEPPSDASSGSASRSPSAWRSWPAVVISFAIVAIVAALILMVWPAARAELSPEHRSRLPPPPAPERMETEPNVQPAAPRRPDPAPNAPAPNAPAPQAQPADPPARDPGADATDPDGANDPMPNPLHPAPGGAVLQPSAARLVAAMASRLCHKLLECKTIDDATRTACDMLARNAIPPRCVAAERCLAQIDRLTCSSRDDMIRHMGVLTQSTDCAAAAQC
jgi:hypothetical protein